MKYYEVIDVLKIDKVLPRVRLAIETAETKF